MHFFNISLPSSLPNYEIHRHLHVIVGGEGRHFLYHRDGDLTRVISKVAPRVKSEELAIEERLYSFVLRAAVTKKPINGRARIDVRNKLERIKWIKNKVSPVGEVEFVDVMDVIDTGKDNMKRIYASFSGVVRVINADAFSALLMDGVGKEKAFGCGMFYLPEVMK